MPPSAFLKWMPVCLSSVALRMELIPSRSPPPSSPPPSKSTSTSPPPPPPPPSNSYSSSSTEYSSPLPPAPMKSNSSPWSRSDGCCGRPPFLLIKRSPLNRPWQHLSFSGANNSRSYKALLKESLGRSHLPLDTTCWKKLCFISSLSTTCGTWFPTKNKDLPHFFICLVFLCSPKMRWSLG
ncbi:hypothetical protein LguiB_026572 [Lonicera macranthoides]